GFNQVFIPMEVGKMLGFTLCLLIGVSCSKVNSPVDIAEGDEVNEDTGGEDNNVDGECIDYVSSVDRGRGDGEEALHAADFLDDKFWVKVQQELQTRSVTVKFAVGNYQRAYTEKTFTLKGMGHDTHHLILEGSDTQQTIFTAPKIGDNETVVPLMVSIMDCQNITIRDFHFRGEGSVRYVLRVSSTPEGGTKNISIE